MSILFLILITKKVRIKENTIIQAHSQFTTNLIDVPRPRKVVNIEKWGGGGPPTYEQWGGGGRPPPLWLILRLWLLPIYYL